MQTLLEDLRYAGRQLRKSPGFALTVVLTLAVGIGATTAIFTLVYDVLLKPLPYAHPEQLVVLEEQVAEFRDIYPKLPVNAGHYAFWRQHSTSFQASALMRDLKMPLGGGDHPRQISVLEATPGVFSALAAAPLLGRTFTPQDAEPGHQRVAVLMESLWQQQFQKDPNILGRTIPLNGFPYTVIGVMPLSLHLPHTTTFASKDSNREDPIEALLPLVLFPEDLKLSSGDFDYFGLARLKPGVSAAQASGEINAFQHTIMGLLPPDEKATLSATLTPLQQALVGDNRTPLLVLLAAVAGLLLVGCVNITNLLLARAAGRRQQMAVASALGASRGAMLHMALRETTLLAAVGGSLGILLAMILVPGMQRFLPSALDFRGPLHLDWYGAACALCLAILSTLLAGAIPAWMMAHTSPQEVLHSESRLASESRNSKQMRRLLVAGEVAVSVTLVLLTGLLTASLYHLLNTNRGFATARIVTATVDLPYQSFAETPARFALYKQILQRISELPGVEHAGAVSNLPLSGDQWIDTAKVPGDNRPMMQMPTEHFRWVSPGYFETIHLPLIAGRFLSDSDQGKQFAVISERTARTLWPGKDPIGQPFTRAGVSEPPFTVIGVVGNARTITLAAPDPMMVYTPYWYRSDSTAGLVVRTRQDPALMADAIRKTIWSVNASVPVPVVSTLGGVVEDSLANRRFEMNLLVLFALSALLLAGLGVYGVVNYSVVQRQREIGLRLALGAQQSNIYRLVLRDGLAPVLLGVVVGVAVAFASARVVASLLYQVSAYDSIVSATAVCLLLSVGVLACLLPARRAASVDPMEALRRE
jgi:predicted permease